MSDQRDDFAKWVTYATGILDVYNGFLGDVTDVLKKHVDEIEARSNNDEPRSPEDKATLALISEILDCVVKSQAEYKKVKAKKDGND